MSQSDHPRVLVFVAVSPEDSMLLTAMTPALGDVSPLARKNHGFIAERARRKPHERNH